MTIKYVPGKRPPNVGIVLVAGWTVLDTVCQMSVGMQSGDKLTVLGNEKTVNRCYLCKHELPEYSIYAILNIDGRDLYDKKIISGRQGESI